MQLKYEVMRREKEQATEAVEEGNEICLEDAVDPPTNEMGVKRSTRS